MYNITPFYTHHILYYRRRRSSLGWSFFWVFVVGVIVTLAIIFSVRYGVPSDNSSGNEYAPNETRIVNYSPIFCSGIDINVDAPILDTSTILSVLSKKPQLKDHDTFQFKESPTFSDFDEDYKYWSYYLPQGSTFGFSACKQGSYSHMKYYLIRGEKNLKSWVNNPKPNNAIYSNSISNICTSGSTTDYKYTVKDDDEYYMVFYLQSGSTSEQLQITFDVYRTKYVPVPGSSLGNCSINQYDYSCSLTVPLETTYGFLTLESDFVNDWSHSYTINVNCVARVWVYVAISLSTVAFFILIMVVISACCFYFVHQNKKKYASLANQTLSQATVVVPDAPAPSTAAVVTDKEAPPPYNPSYGDTAAPKFY